MAKQCIFSGKKTRVGNKVTRRGIPKKKKGIGLNTTGITKRKFFPNLQKRRFWFAQESRFITLKVSTSVMRTITKKGLFFLVHELRKQGHKI